MRYNCKKIKEDTSEILEGKMMYHLLFYNKNIPNYHYNHIIGKKDCEKLDKAYKENFKKFIKCLRESPNKINTCQELFNKIKSKKYYLFDKQFEFANCLIKNKKILVCVKMNLTK